MSSDRSKTFLAVALVGFVTAAVLLLAFDFAGWETTEVSSRTRFLYSADPVNVFRTRVDRDISTQVRYYVAPINVFGPYAVAIAPIVLLLLYGAYVTFQGLRNGIDSIPLRTLRRAFYAAVIAAAVAFGGGVLFELAMQISDPEDWWHDAGFYAGFSAPATSAVFLWLLIKSRSSTESASSDA